MDVKRWKPLKNARKYDGKQVFVGSVCDPYMPEEAEYGRTRALLEELVGSGMEVSLQTKSDLVLRDIDLISQLPGARVGFSINTLDEGFPVRHGRGRARGATPCRHEGAARRRHPHDLLHLAHLPRRSPTCPPSSRPRATGATLVWLENLNLRGGYKADILGYIAEKRPELMPLYDAVYQKGDRTYWRELDVEVRAYAEREGLEYVRDDDTVRSPFDAPPVIVNYFFHEEIRSLRRRRAGMPELPEVETVRRVLEPQLAGRVIEGVDVLNGPGGRPSRAGGVRERARRAQDSRAWAGVASTSLWRLTTARSWWSTCA